MENNQVKQNKLIESNKLALHYMQTLIDVARESFIIMDSSLRVITANSIFYQNFKVLPEQTEGRFLHELGNGQWNIPKLKRLLEEVLLNKKIVKDYEVTHIFEIIGKKTIKLNARQIDSVQLIILAMEDITDKKELEEKMAEYTKGLEIQVAKRTANLADRIKELELLNKTMVGRELKMVELKKENECLKKRVSNSNGKNGNGNGNHKNGR